MTQSDITTPDQDLLPAFPEIKWLLNLNDIRSLKDKKSYEANDEQKLEIANHLSLGKLDNFKIDVFLRSTRYQDQLLLRVWFSSKGAQTCVVSGDDMPFQIELKEERDLKLTESPELEAHEVKIGEIDLNEPEYLPDGMLDVFQLALEYLSLELDPFPRKDGAEFQPLQEEDLAIVADDKKPNPFAVLQALKDKK